MSLETRISALATAIAAEFNGRPQGVVPLGRWSGTSVASLAADNIFDASIYSSYIITGELLPATDNVTFLAALRTATPSDVGGGMLTGGAYARLDGAGSGTLANSTGLSGSVGNGADEGIAAFEMHLHMRSGKRHAFSQRNTVVQYSGARFNIAYSGEFVDTTPRQGIKFYFSSGNIAAGWIEVIGIKKQ